MYYIYIYINRLLTDQVSSETGSATCLECFLTTLEGSVDILLPLLACLSPHSSRNGRRNPVKQVVLRA